MTTEIFQDSKDRAWALQLTFGDLKRVLDLTGINLAKPGRQVTSEDEFKDLAEEDYPVYLKLAYDPMLLVDVVYSMLKPQADEKGVDAATFGSSITGNVFNDIQEKFWKVYHNFFLEAGDGLKARQVEGILMSRRLTNKHAASLGTLMENKEAELEAGLEKELEAVNKRIETITR